MFSVLFFSLLLHADQVPKSPLPLPAFQPPFTCFKQGVPSCDQIEARLIEYNKNITEHATALIDYVSTVHDVIQGWYDNQFSPLQSGAIPLTDNFFDFVTKDLGNIDEASTFAAQTRSCMKDELDKILVAVQNCKKSTVP